MRTDIRRTLMVLAVAAGAAAMNGCSSTTTIRSDLLLDPHAGARIELHQPTEALELVNDSDTAVRVKVLGKKDVEISNMTLNAHDRARLDINPAKAVSFDNQGDVKAVVHWTLRNSKRIEYTLAMQP